VNHKECGSQTHPRASVDSSVLMQSTVEPVQGDADSTEDDTSATPVSKVKVHVTVSAGEFENAR